MINRIALTGVSRSGKDEVAKILVQEFGYVRHSFGDIIKRQLRELIYQHTGIDSYTEDDSKKKIIRPTLEAWSETNADGLMREYWDTAPKKLVNNRLIKVREAETFRCYGDAIIWVERPGFGPATEWERQQLAQLRSAGLINGEILNNGTIEDLRTEVCRLIGGIA